MKKYMFIALLMKNCLFLAGQIRENFYLLDENFKESGARNAKYLLRSVKENDSSWQFDTYNVYGPLIASERYKNNERKTAHGISYYYGKNGFLDSSGFFSAGLQNGLWYYFNDSMKITTQKTYSSGTLVGTKEFGKSGYIQTEKPTDTLSKHILVESDYSGGVNHWLYYLNKHATYPDRAQTKGIQGTVVISFYVDTAGQVVQPVITKSVEYSLDQEAIRLIVQSSEWVPATLDGKKITAYKRQPITFNLTKY